MSYIGSDMAGQRYTDNTNQIGVLMQRAVLAGLTRREIAKELGVTDRTLRRWVAGRADLRLETYRKLERLLQLAED